LQLIITPKSIIYEANIPSSSQTYNLVMKDCIGRTYTITDIKHHNGNILTSPYFSYTPTG